MIAADHRVHLFLSFAFDRSHDVLAALAALTLNDVANPGWIDPARSAGAGGVSEKRVWEVREWSVSRDLHPFARVVLDSRRERNASSPHRLVLSPHAKNLIAGAYREAPVESAGSPPPGLVLALAGGGRVHVQLREVGLHIFQTGVAVAVVDLAIAADAAWHKNARIATELLVGALPRLCDQRRRTALRWDDAGSAPPGDGFTIEDVIRSLVRGTPLVPAACDRLYSLCTVIFEETIPAELSEEIGWRLSRHYSADYEPTPERFGTAFVKPFANVLHAVSREGTCTLLQCAAGAASPAPEFLQSWLQGSEPHVYVPLHVLAYHQHVVLLRLGQATGRHVDLETVTAAELAELNTLCNEIRLFRLGYRLVQISAITMHDLVYGTVERALGIPELSEKLARDLTAVEPRLLEISAERVESRYRWLTRVLTAGFAYLTLSGVFTHMAEAITGKAEAVPAPVTLAIQSVSVAAAIAAFIIIGLRLKTVGPPIQDVVGASVE